jgi:hypothetical protein
MEHLHIQFIAEKSKEETAEGLRKIANALRATMTCKVEPVREVMIPDKGAGWVVDIIIPKVGMTYREMMREVSKFREIYKWCVE